MSEIRASDDVRVYQIQEFLGLNENPDGDTRIKKGELANMRNFRITPDMHLQIRPGQKTIIKLREVWDALPDKPAEVTEPKGGGVWTGLVNGKEHTIAAYGGVLWDISVVEGVAPKEIGRATQDTTSFFGFSNKVYMLNGHEYLSWDGGADTKFVTVEGYIPTVMTATPPNGNGVKLENVNRLTGKRRVKFSGDGESTTYVLEEANVDEVVSVKGTSIPYSLHLNGNLNSWVEFQTAPPTGTNNIEIIYRKGDGERAQVTGMRYAELYNGSTSDSRVFLYGDGTNKTIYSGNDLDKAVATAEYFPDLYEASIGEANSPITSLIRHYSRLLAFKQDSTWALDSAIVGVPGGGTITAFQVVPVNKALGNEAPGQVRLIENNPLSFAEGGIYQWKAAGNFAVDHRNADKVSDRVNATVSGMKLPEVKTFNRQRHSEFWVLWGGKALILNYQTNTWYIYTNMPYAAMTEVDSETYGFCDDGRIVHLSREYRNDDTAEIDAYAETGAMDFGKDWLLKYSPMIWVAIKPESGGRVNVTVETNKRSGTTSYDMSEYAIMNNYPAKVVTSGWATFLHADFAHWSFNTSHRPQVRRVKLKVKKATFYKLIFWSKSASATATVLGADIQLRYAGKVK